MREEDRITLRQSMFPETVAEFMENPENAHIPSLSGRQQELFDGLVERMGMGNLLDLPVIALSNGQTRRARIIRAVLAEPELLLLDEPLSM